MRSNFAVFVATMVACSGVVADQSQQCAILFATAFGARGGITVSLNDQGDFAHWHDRFDVQGIRRIPDFQRDDWQVYLGKLGELHSLSSQPLGDVGASYSVTTDKAGIVKLISPDLRTYAINFPDGGTARVAALYRPALREREPRKRHEQMGEYRNHSVSDDNLRHLLEQESAQATPENNGVMYLYVAIGNTVYRATLRAWQGVTHADLRTALLSGPARVRRTHDPLRLAPDRLYVEPINMPMLDLAIEDGSELWLPTTDQNQAVEIGDRGSGTGADDT